MRKVFLFLILFFSLPFGESWSGAYAQNLVPNPSFEDTIGCPNNEDKVYLAKGWSSFGNSPDYFNACGIKDGVGVPNNNDGYQNAATGKSYCGIFTYAGVIKNYREFIGRPLSSPFVIGNKYFVSAKVSLAENSNCATNNLGMSFSTIPYSELLSIPINNNGIIYSKLIITDTSNWTIISGTFIADSSYRYVIVGNFFKDANTDSITYWGNLCNAYYFIDDVCVSPDSSACDFGDGIKSMSTSAFNIYPNPANDKIYFSSNFSGNYRYSLINLLGEEIKGSPSSEASAVDVTDIPNGIYILRISYQNKTIQRKQVVLH